jgi:Flp pilus assembly protein TadD
MNRHCVKAVVLVLFLSTFRPLPAVAQQTQPRAQRPAQIRGQIRLPNGRSASRGISVTLDMSTGGTATQTQTDSQGKFEFMQVPPAMYEVRVSAVGFLPDSQSVDLVSIPNAYLTFTLKPDPSYGNASASPAGPGGVISALDAGAPEPARKDLESGRDLLTKGKDLKGSIKFFKKAISQYPQYPEAYLLMGVAYSSQKNWDDAEKSLRKAIELNDASPMAYISLGSVENEKKNYADAEKLLLKAVQMSPESADANFELGRTYWGLERWDAADRYVAKAIELRPNDADQHILMGNVRLRERNAEGALKEFQEAVRLDPKGPMAEPTREMIGRIQAALKQAEKQKK